MREKWQNGFILGKNNKRMENETVYIALAYLQFYENNSKPDHQHPLEYYKVRDKNVAEKLDLKTENDQNS